MSYFQASTFIELRVFILESFFFPLMWFLFFCFFFSSLPPTQGLCGNFNNIQTDDFRTATGAVEDSASAFGNSWKTRASCFDVEDSFEDPCSNSVDKGSRLFIHGLSVLNNFPMINNWKSFRKLVDIKHYCLWDYYEREHIGFLQVAKVAALLFF